MRLATRRNELLSSVPHDDLLLRLAQHRSLGTAPSEELAWLSANGAPHSYRAGDVTTHKGHAEEWLQVVLSGRLAIRADRGAGSRKVIEWRGGDVCGLMPYSRGGSPPGDTVAEEPTDTLAVHRDRLAEMIRACPRVTAVLVHAMLDRARHFTSSDLHDEKLVSLGKLAAGLAHELNNPASAAVRSAKMLARACPTPTQPRARWRRRDLSERQLAVVDRGARGVSRAPRGTAIIDSSAPTARMRSPTGSRRMVSTTRLPRRSPTPTSRSKRSIALAQRHSRRGARRGASIDRRGACVVRGARVGNRHVGRRASTSSSPR